VVTRVRRGPLRAVARERNDAGERKGGDGGAWPLLNPVRQREWGGVLIWGAPHGEKECGGGGGGLPPTFGWRLNQQRSEDGGHGQATRPCCVWAPMAQCPVAAMVQKNSN
jgi:hypothetical protein